MEKDSNSQVLYVVTGIAGSGKSTALKAFADLGFFCVENLPASLIGDFVRYLRHSIDAGQSPSDVVTNGVLPNRPLGYAILVNCREKDSHHCVMRERDILAQLGINLMVLFFDCQDEVVLRRYQETRRPHPVSVQSPGVSTLGEALAIERKHLRGFRGLADLVIDTSSYSPHDLRRRVEDLVGTRSSMQVEIASFGFKFGMPRDADLVVDVRFLPNPHFVSELRPLTGERDEVKNFVFQSGDAQEFVDRYGDLLSYLLPRYAIEGKRYLTVAIGCTGGKHRSVAVAQAIGDLMQKLGFPVAVNHRDKDRI